MLAVADGLSTNAYQTVSKGRTSFPNATPLLSNNSSIRPKKGLRSFIGRSHVTHRLNSATSSVNINEKNQVEEPRNECNIQVAFSHVHLYVDKLEDIQAYKRIEDKLNAFATEVSRSNDIYSNGRFDLKVATRAWRSLGDDEEISNEPFLPHGRDVVKQLLCGLGYRVSGMMYPSSDNSCTTRNLLVTSRDPNGVQVVVSAVDETQNDGMKNVGESKEEVKYLHFDAGKDID